MGTICIRKYVMVDYRDRRLEVDDAGMVRVRMNNRDEKGTFFDNTVIQRNL